MSSYHPSTTRKSRLSLAELEPYKDAIEKLFIEEKRSEKEVLKKLRSGGLDISFAQLELQLRRWGMRKNLDRQEWAYIIRQLNQPWSRDKKVRVKIAGQVVPEAKLARARKRYRREAEGGEESTLESLPSYASIEFLNSDGQWLVLGDAPTTPHSGMQLLVTASQDLETRLPQSRAPFGSGSSNLSSTTTADHLDAPHFPNALCAQNQVLRSSDTFNSVFMASSGRVTADWDDLHFTNNEMAVVGAPTKQQIQSWLNNISFTKFIQAFDSGNNKLKVRRGNAQQSILDHFFANTGTTCLSTVSKHKLGNNVTALKNAASRQDALWSMLPGHATAHDLLGNETVFKDKFIQLLVFSMGNGLAGLGHRSQHALFRTLMSFNGLGRALAQFLRRHGTRYSQPLAESLFKAAVAHRDAETVQELLKYQLVNVDTITMHDENGTPRTAVETAALLQDLNMVRLLCQHGVRLKACLQHIWERPKIGNDLLFGPTFEKSMRRMNKTLQVGLVLYAFTLAGRTKPPDSMRVEFNSDWIQELGLIHAALLPVSNTSDAKGVEIVKLFLEAGIQVTTRLIALIVLFGLEDFFPALLLDKIQSQQHVELIQDGIVVLFAEYLSDEKATSLTRKLLFDCCVETDCRQCRQGGSLKWLNDAACLALEKEKTTLLTLLLSFSTPMESGDVLNAAIAAGNNQLTRTLLDNDFDIHVFARFSRIRLEGDMISSGIGSIHKYANDFPHSENGHKKTTPYAQAILSGNKIAIRSLEEKGAKDWGPCNCGPSRHRDAVWLDALLAATYSNDVAFTRDIYSSMLDFVHPGLGSPVMYGIMALSIKRGREDALQFLLKEGIATAGSFAMADNDEFRKDADASVSMDALTEAIRAQRKDLVATILGLLEKNQEPKCYSQQVMHWFNEALVSGNTTILGLLQTALPGYRIDWDTMTGISSLEQFELVISRQLAHFGAVGGSLGPAVASRDSRFVQRVVDCIIAPCDEDFEFVIKAGRRDVLLSLIEKSKRCYPLGVSRSRLVRACVKEGAWGLEACLLCLESGLLGVIMPCEETSIFSALLEGDMKFHYNNVFGPNDYYGSECADVEYDHNVEAILRSLSQAGYDPEVLGWSSTRWKYRGDQSALLLAIAMKKKRWVEILLDHGADINREAVLGIRRTPLQEATQAGCLQLVEFLLSRGADVNGKPAQINGATALQLGAASGNCNLVSRLFEAGADLYQEPSVYQGQWPLEAAAERGRLDMIDFLWNASKGFGRRFDDEMCKESIRLAYSRGHGGCARRIKDLMGSWPPDAQAPPEDGEGLGFMNGISFDMGAVYELD